MKIGATRVIRVTGWLVSVALVLSFVAVSARGQAPQELENARQPKVILSTSSHALKFAKDPKQPETQSFTLSASGGAVTGTIGEPVAPFSIVSGGGTLYLSPGYPHTVTVQFAPSKKGTFHSAILISSNARDKKLKVNLSGIANAPVPTSTITATATITQTATVTPTPTSTATVAPPIASGDVLITGGFTPPSGSALSSAEIYQPNSGAFARTGNMAAGRDFQTATVLSNGKVLVFGSNGAVPAAELYDPATGTFSATSGTTGSVSHQTSTRLNNGQVLIVGGESGISTLPCPTSSPAPVGNGYQLVPFAHTGGTILYNPTTDSFAQSAGPARLIHSATLLQDGRVLISGGAHDSACPGDFTINTAFLYDATGASFAATGNLNAARGAHTATLLHNGLVLVAGGVDPNGFILNTAELYDPTTAQFVSTSKMTHERAAHTAVLLTSGALAGKVLMAGGLTNGGSEDTAELYDPNTGMFTSTGKLIVGRFNHVAVLLPDGKVLIAGGQVSSGSANSAELYDPATGTFAATGNMRDQRAAYTATLLP